MPTALTRFIVLFLILILFAYKELGYPLLWEIPEGFHGWVVAQFDDPNCSQLPRHELYQVVKISSDGKACTSTSMSEKWVYDGFERIDATGHLTILSSTGQDPSVWFIESSEESHKLLVFIGRKAELDAHWGERPRIAPLHLALPLKNFSN